MKPPQSNEHPDAAAIEAEAMAWLAERDEGFAPGRAAAFDSWCRRDARHAASVAELEQVLTQLDGLADQRAAVNAHFNRISPARPTLAVAPAPLSFGQWWRPVAWGGLAAALAFGSFFGFRAWRSTAAPETRYTTTTAGYERARLADGSTLELNTASTARVRITATERQVELESGEAHFEVAHDTARPFVVRAGGVAVRAVGTAFNVRFNAGKIEVIVTEGKVNVGPASFAVRPAGEHESREGASPSLGQTLVSAYERVAIPVTSPSSNVVASAPAIERLAPEDVRAALAWQRRATEFSDTPLAEIAARFNRYHSLQLVVADPELGGRRIGGIFALDDVESFVRLLERDGIVRAERKGDTVQLRAP